MTSMKATLFEVPIIHLMVENWQEKKQKLVNIIKLVNSKINLSNNIYTDYFTNQNSYDKNIAEIFSSEIDSINSLLNQNLCIDNCWFQVAKKHNYHGPHTHGAIGYSVVCYIQYNKNLHPGITLVAPFSDFITGYPIECKPNISEGSLLCFPSNVLHYTEPNLSDIDRIILSFNLKCR